LRKSWQLINTVINRKKTTNRKISSLNINGTKTHDSLSIAEHFTKYFTNIGKTLDKKIPPSSVDPVSFIPHNNPNSVYLMPCIQDEILKAIANLKHCAIGWDGIPTSLIQNNSIPFSICLTHIINLSLTQGIFPSELKVAILVPIFKAGDSNEPGNF
jgi:hypothetical protein